jgi:hypothetical protein
MQNNNETKLYQRRNTYDFSVFLEYFVTWMDVRSNIHQIGHSNPEDRKTKLSRIVGHQTPNDAVQFPKTAKDLTVQLRKLQNNLLSDISIGILFNEAVSF